GNLHVAHRTKAERKDGREARRSFAEASGLDRLRGNFSFHCSDNQSRRNGNGADAFASAHAAIDLGRTDWTGSRGQHGLGVGTLWSLDQCEALLSSHRNFSAALYGPGCDLYLP